MTETRKRGNTDARPDRSGSSVVVIGGANVDIVASAPALHPQVSNPGRIRLGAGGAGRNIAENLARLGVRTQLICAVGDDPLSDLVLAQTRDAGVHLLGTVRIPGLKNAYVAIMSPDAVTWAASDMAAAESLTPDQVAAHAAVVQAADFVVIDANLSPETIAASVRLAEGRRLCLLPVSAAKATRIAPHLTAAQLIVLSAAEAQVLTAEPVHAVSEASRAIGRLRRSADTTVVVTMGDHGLVWGGREVIPLPAPPVVVADPSGAGDAVAAAAVYALLAGLDDRTAAHLALAAGAVTVTVERSTHPRLTLDTLYAHAHIAAPR